MIFGDHDRGRPNDERGFVHKKLLGLVSKVSGFIPGPVGGFVSAVTGRLAGTSRTVPRTLTARTTQASAAGKEFGRGVKFNGGFTGPTAGRIPLSLGPPGPRRPGFPPPPLSVLPTGLHPPQQIPCRPPLVRNPDGVCVDPTSPFGASTMFGEAVMGQYGAALVPGSQIIDRATCPRGTQLGNDGLCYNKGQITNKQRMWPAGRKPILSGGDLRAISIAARAGRRMDLATKRLQKLGMMKKPRSAPAPRAHAHAKPVAAVSVAQ